MKISMQPGAGRVRRVALRLLLPIMSRKGSPKSLTVSGPVEWVKSSLSFANGNCVEVADLGEAGVAVRNSRKPGGPVLEFTNDEWRAFIGGAHRGEFDRFGA
jgi:hypothetical protein